jgi:hypothetical protein
MIGNKHNKSKNSNDSRLKIWLNESPKNKFIFSIISKELTLKCDKFTTNTAYEYIQKNLTHEFSNQIINWKIFLKDSFNIKFLNKKIKKIIISCGSPGSGKTPKCKNLKIDFDLIGYWVYKKLKCDIPVYILADSKVFRKYIHIIEKNIIKILCNTESFWENDVVIISCDCEKVIKLLDNINKRFKILINIKYNDLPTYEIWSSFQNKRKELKNINYREFTEKNYDEFLENGNKTWDFITKLSKERPEINIEKIRWDSKCNSKTNLFDRNIYTLTSKGEIQNKKNK